MKISYSLLSSFFKKPLPQPEKLAEILTMHSFENESIEKKKNDWILNLDVLPDRGGDCFSHLGIAKECAALLNLKISFPSIKIKEGKEKINNFLKVEIKDKNCQRYSVRVIANVIVGPSPKSIQDRLIDCGMNPINNIVDAANYVMLELGQPLHAFDYDKIQGKKIIVRKAKPNENVVLLNGNEYVLDKKTMVIADEKDVLAIAGIKGGKKAEISEKTKTIVLESASFEPKTIGQTARRLNLRTDASARFEHNLDPNLTEIALNRASQLIGEWAKGETAKGIIDIYPEKIKPKKIKLDFELINKVLGIIIPQNEIINILNRLGIKVLIKTKYSLSLEIPTFRQDLVIAENVIEEIGRIYGYEKIPSLLPPIKDYPVKKSKFALFLDKARGALKELNFAEVYNYSFIGDKEKNKYQLKPEEILNPTSSLSKYLRPSLIPLLEKNIEENLKWFEKVKIFEAGKVFFSQGEKIGEKTMLAGGVSFEKNRQKDFLRFKGEVVFLLNQLGIKNSAFVKYSGNLLEIIVDKEKVGKIMVSDQGLFFELDFDALIKYANDQKEYEKISYHPSAIRDVSGIVDEKVSLEEIKEKIEQEGSGLIKNLEFFDVYQGSKIGKGKKNVSFHIIFQSEEKTLDSNEIEKIQKEIIKILSEQLGWEERK
ncbi:MAG TPA: phenylalanine--tRNA ligase subunit beta [Candidatus Pacearchaeota archaeon]|nr:phenylalanine--tRNA ligase subunit beta [Candidatus Pacearchaeota archaeon]